LVRRRSRRSQGPLFLGWKWGRACDVETYLFEHATSPGKARRHKARRHVGVVATRHWLGKRRRNGEETKGLSYAGTEGWTVLGVSWGGTEGTGETRDLGFKELRFRSSNCAGGRGCRGLVEWSFLMICAIDGKRVERVGDSRAGAFARRGVLFCERGGWGVEVS